ncbi:MAG: FAD-dependent oxidoreductase [Alphaproteobacteria bacterium]|nr:FAD-dependent oxidoreductase [Alphaproteobacteria bacterium]
MSRYPHALSPTTLGPLALRNRIFVPAHTTNYGRDHLPSDRHLEYHRARARGGAGLIIFESVRVQKNTVGRPQGVAGYDPRCVEPFARIARAVQAEGARLLGQVIHLGRQIEGEWERTVSWGPSAVRWSATAQVPHAMTRAEMDLGIESHVHTARHLMEAGLDGIEVQVGHGHLLQQFLSPASNVRTDEFGGTLENRLRFPLAVVRAVREALGPAVCMGIRVSAEEYLEGGLSLAEMIRVVPMIAEAVTLDFVNVSHSAYHGSYSLATQMADMNVDATPFRALPTAIRAALRDAGHTVPVMAVCKFRSVAEAEAMLAAGGADFVGMARAHLADPDLVRRAAEGREDSQRPCIGCNQGCAAMLERNLPLTCLVNPRGGREGDMKLAEASPSATPRHVLVVGGGPAGLEAAWVAAARGHRVTLWERARELGGQTRWIRAMPHRSDFLKLIDYQLAQCRRHQVRIETGRAADAAAIRALGADVAILATGSRPTRTTFPSGRAALTMEEALADPARCGDAVALVDAIGEWSSLSLAEHLARLGKRVTVFVPVGSYSWRTTIYSTFANRKRLRDLKVKLALLRAVRDWDGTTLTVEDVSTGEVERLAGYASVVSAQYNEAEDALQQALTDEGVEWKAIGDCLAPRTALEAVYEGHELGLAL